MNDFIWHVVKKVTSGWTYIAILTYITFGALFVGLRNFDYNFINVFFLGISNSKFLSFIMYPSFILIFLYTYNIINNSSALILRLENKKEYIIVNLKAMIGVSIIFFTTIILIFLILTSLSSYKGGPFISKELGYNSIDIIVIITWLLKFYLTTIVLGLIILLSLYLSNKQNISSIIGFIYIGLISGMGSIIPSNNLFWLYISPSFNSNSVFSTTDINLVIKAGLIHFILLFSTLIFLINRSVKNYSIGVMIK